jgi:hypothetical protein
MLSSSRGVSKRRGTSVRTSIVYAIDVVLVSKGVNAGHQLGHGEILDIRSRNESSGSLGSWR